MKTLTKALEALLIWLIYPLLFCALLAVVIVCLNGFQMAPGFLNRLLMILGLAGMAASGRYLIWALRPDAPRGPAAAVSGPGDHRGRLKR